MNEIATTHSSDAEVVTKVLSQSSQASFRGGAYEDASAALDAAASQAPSDGHDWFQVELARVRQRLSLVDVSGASDAVEAALVVAAQRVAAYEMYVSQSGGSISATAVPRRPVSLVTALSRFAAAFFNEGEIDAAKALWSRALDENSSAVKAKLGLAKVALAEADPASAWTLARAALTAGLFTAKTIVAWEILARAAKQGGGVFDATLVPLLDQARPTVRARSMVAIARAARRFNHLDILSTVTAWAIANKVQFPIESLEILKASRGKGKAGDTGYSVRNLTIAIDSVTGKLPREVLAETCTKLKLQFTSTTPNISGIIADGIGGLVEPSLSKTRHALARVLIAAGAYYGDARLLLTLNVASSDASIRGRALIALGKLEYRAQNYASSAQYYQQAVASGTLSGRYRSQVISGWVKSAGKAGNSISLDSAIMPLLSTLVTSEEFLEIARTLGASSSKPTSLGTSALVQGLELATTAITSSFDSVTNRYIAFTAMRAARECKEFEKAKHFYYSVIQPRQTLWWSGAKEYWDLLTECVWGVQLGGDAETAQALATSVVADTATPSTAKVQMLSTVGRIALFISHSRTTAEIAFAEGATHGLGCVETLSCCFWLGVIQFQIGAREAAATRFNEVLQIGTKHQNVRWVRQLVGRAKLFLSADANGEIPVHPLREYVLADILVAAAAA